MSDNSLVVPLDTNEGEIIKRTDEERERDKVLIARMYVRGKSQHEMVDTLSAIYAKSDRPFTHRMVHRELEEIRKAWLQSTIIDFNLAKSKELARLDEAEREAWEAWERSKEKHVRIEYEVSDDQVPFSMDKVADVHRKKKHKIIEATVGDYKYLEMVERMIRMRCDILGLFEASKIQIDWRAEAQQAGMPEDVLDAVKEATVRTLVIAIEQAAEKSGAIKPEDIIDAESEDI